MFVCMCVREKKVQSQLFSQTVLGKIGQLYEHMADSSFRTRKPLLSAPLLLKRASGLLRKHLLRQQLCLPDS